MDQRRIPGRRHRVLSHQPASVRRSIARNLGLGVPRMPYRTEVEKRCDNDSREISSVKPQFGSGGYHVRRPSCAHREGICEGLCRYRRTLNWYRRNSLMNSIRYPRHPTWNRKLPVMSARSRLLEIFRTFHDQSKYRRSVESCLRDVDILLFISA